MKPGDPESLAAKLVRLRREGPPPQKLAQTLGASQANLKEPMGNHPDRVPTQTAENSKRQVPQWLQTRLQASHKKSKRTREEARSGHKSSDCTVAKTSGLPEKLELGEGGGFYFRKTVMPFEHAHGLSSLGSTLPADTEAFVLLTEDARLADLDAKDVLYLDTETTGLSGGAGVFVYMVGLARFVDRDPSGALLSDARSVSGREPAWDIEVWQGFMAGPEQEKALLEEVRRRILASSGIVSFFGKSFDRHRLEDKMQLHGIAPPFADKLHLDLYHPLRRLHKGAYRDTKLQTLERELCGVVRPDDLPGSLAPEAWFDFLAGRAHRLEGVFRHNLDDVLSLIVLLGWLAKTTKVQSFDVDSEIGVPQWIRESALASALAKAGQKERALERLRCIMLPSSRNAAPQSLWLQRAQIEGSVGQFEQALGSLNHGFPTWTPHPDSIKALALASKWKEHGLREHKAALQDCETAQALLKTMRPFSGRSPLEGEVTRRALRLRARETKQNTAEVDISEAPQQAAPISEGLTETRDEQGVGDS